MSLMGKKKQPKFKKGDTVVITMYGTVGKITDVKFMDESFVYEVNHSQGLYLENTLQSVEEYEGELVSDSEHIDIEYKFTFGDLVQVDGYERDYFKILGFRTEIWRYKEDAWEDIVYELSRISDGEWLEAHEEEITLIADAERAESIMSKLGLIEDQQKTSKVADSLKKNGQKTEPISNIQEGDKKEFIDGLLDLYNDYQMLYKWFGDEDYFHVMKIALLKIKKTVEDTAGDEKLKN